MYLERGGLSFELPCMCGQPCMIQWIVHSWLATRTCWVMSKYLSARTVASDEDVIKAKKMKSIRDFTSQLKREVENLQNQHVRDQSWRFETETRSWNGNIENETQPDVTGCNRCGRGCNFRQDYRISRDHVLKGTGGVPGQKIFFLRLNCLNICCSPGYLVFKMGSLASLLQTVFEIWGGEVGAFSTFSIGKSA